MKLSYFLPARLTGGKERIDVMDVDDGLLELSTIALKKKLTLLYSKKESARLADIQMYANPKHENRKHTDY